MYAIRLKGAREFFVAESAVAAALAEVNGLPAVGPLTRRDGPTLFVGDEADADVLAVVLRDAAEYFRVRKEAAHRRAAERLWRAVAEVCTSESYARTLAGGGDAAA